MRKMFSKNQIESIVNQGIQSGEIKEQIFMYELHGTFTSQEETEYDLYLIIASSSPNYTLQDAQDALGSGVKLFMPLYMEIEHNGEKFTIVNPMQLFIDGVFLGISGEDSATYIQIMDECEFESINSFYTA